MCLRGTEQDPEAHDDYRIVEAFAVGPDGTEMKAKAMSASRGQQKVTVTVDALATSEPTADPGTLTAKLSAFGQNRWPTIVLLVAYKRITRARQEQAMDDLVHLSEDMGL